MSFDDVKNVKEACDVLDTFFSVSERTRIKDLYNLCKEKNLRQLVESTIRQKNTIHRRLRYLNKFYSNMTVELLRFKGLMVKERTLREDVLGSRFFQARGQVERKIRNYRMLVRCRHYARIRRDRREVLPLT